MTRILHLDSSPRGDRSMSRTLSGEFIDAWKKSHPEDTVQYRDLGRQPVPHVDENWIAGAFTKEWGLKPGPFRTAFLPISCHFLLLVL